MPAERLQKVLASAGIASRRAAEELILSGRVRVNGRIVRELGTKADLRRDKIEVNGERIVREDHVYYVLHKPREVVTTLSDPEGRETIAAFLKTIPERVFPVGRLDYQTSGALILTNDGRMAEALLRPRRGVPKVYAVKVRGTVDIPELDKLRSGITLDDGYTTKQAEVFVLREEERNTWIQITLTEGKNRQIHRMLEALGFRVQRLARLSFAGITTEGLRPGDYRELTKKELEKLEKTYGKDAAERHKAEKEAAKRAHVPAGERDATKPRPKKGPPRRKGPFGAAPFRDGPRKEGPPGKGAPRSQGAPRSEGKPRSEGRPLGRGPRSEGKPRGDGKPQSRGPRGAGSRAGGPRSGAGRATSPRRSRGS